MEKKNTFFKINFDPNTLSDEWKMFADY